jgi:hypothetical protein
MYGVPLTVYLLSSWLGSKIPALSTNHAGGHLFNDLIGWNGDVHLSPFHLASYVEIGGGSGSSPQPGGCCSAPTAPADWPPPAPTPGSAIPIRRAAPGDDRLPAAVPLVLSRRSSTPACRLYPRGVSSGGPPASGVPRPVST